MRKRLGETGLLSDDHRAVAAFEEVNRTYRHVTQMNGGYFGIEWTAGWSLSASDAISSWVSLKRMTFT